MAEKKRYAYLDMLRIIAFICVILYHYMVELENHSQYDFSNGILRYSNANIHIATMGVALFFMISGAGLYMTSRDRFSWKEYVSRRFVKLMIPFYIVYGSVWITARIIGYKIHYGEQIPAWRFVFTILGIDQYVEELFPGFATFSLGVGEWFVGCLVLIYLIFPLIRRCMLANWKVTMLIATAMYLSLVLCYPFQIAIHLNVLNKLYEFMLGMSFAMHYDFFSKHRKILSISSISIVVLFACSPYTLPISEGIRITIFALAVFGMVMGAEEMLSNHVRLKNLMKWIGGYTYEMFLIQHYVILTVILVTMGIKKTPASATVIFLLCIACIFILGRLIYVVENGLKRLAGKIK